MYVKQKVMWHMCVENCIFDSGYICSASWILHNPADIYIYARALEISSSNLRTQMSNYASCEHFCLMFTTQARRKIKNKGGM